MRTLMPFSMSALTWIGANGLRRSHLDLPSRRIPTIQVLDMMQVETRMTSGKFVLSKKKNQGEFVCLIQFNYRDNNAGVLYCQNIAFK